MRSSLCFPSLDVLAENPAPCRAAEGAGGQARSGLGRGTLQGDIAEGHRLRDAGPAPPPRRGPVSRQRGGRGRRPRWAAWPGGGEAGPEAAPGPPLALTAPALPACAAAAAARTERDRAGPRRAAAACPARMCRHVPPLRY